MLRTDRQHLPAAGRESKRIRVYDCRFANIKPPGIELRGSDSLDFNSFLHTLRKEFKLQQHERFVLATTDRTVLDFDKFRQLPDGSTLYLLQREDQALPVAMEEHITFRPHYNTLTEGGLYEYYSSEGHNPLSFALAELIDNSLSATAKNSGTRTIEIRMLFDESLGKPAVVVLDNGCGMTSKQLRNWAVYRLSKFTRENSTFASQQEGYVRPDVVPRSLNSDISYFGVGGKQATFFIGNSTRMISKAMGSPDVHELVLSKEEFERKEKNKEDVYSGVIKNRKPGDSSHVRQNDERFLHKLIAEEFGKKSFTAVVITGIVAEHINFFKKDFAKWTRQLAHVYHYYIHGINGNDMRSNATNSNQLPKIDIQVTLQEKPHTCPRVMNLREVQDDMQTLYINATAATFEFKATTGVDSGTVEGVIRYHPFLYDRETYPPDPNAEQAPPNDEDESAAQNQTRGKRPIFECFWNGRLIPYTKVDEFDWCIKGANVPEECYSRFSGVLFTDDRFQVTTNKLTYMDLEVKVKNKQTIFTRIDNGQAIRCNIQKEFSKWLQICHEKLDKQVKFLGFKETITRPEVATKKMQHPWATFSSIELDGKTYKAGQLVKSQKTNPIHHGAVVRFLLYGDHKKDVFATGGEVEVCLEPTALYGTTKVIPITKIDRMATIEAIQKNIDNDFAKLPDQLQLDWPDGNPWPQNAVRPAGSPLGALSIKILNKKGEAISRMPSVGHSAVTKLCVRQVIVFKGPKTTEEVVNYVAQHSAKWSYWFKKIVNLTKPGKYTLCLSTIISDSQATVFGDKPLPIFKLNFTIKEGNAESFVPGPVSSTLRVGVPFDIPLQFKDQYGNLTVGLPDLQPVLSCSDLGLSFEAVDTCGTTYTIKGVRARGKVLNYHQSKTHDLKVTLPGLKEDTQIVKIILLPGTPHSLHVKTEDNPIIVENGNPVSFNVEIHDEAGNITVQPRQMVQCQIKGLTPVVVDCSSTGAGQILTKPINLKIINGEPQNLKVYFSVPSQKNIAVVERELRVLPSTRVSMMKVFSRDDEDLLLRNNDKIEWLAGSSLDSLFYSLYDEAGRAVPLTVEIASQIMVNWKSEVDVQDLVQGKLPDIMVPTKVDEQRSYQVSYQHQNVSVYFTIVPRPDEPYQLKATVPQKTVKMGEILSENITLELADQYGNSTKTLTPNYMNLITVDAVGLDKSSVTHIWQSSNSSVRVTGLRFQSGTPGLRELCFTYLKYEVRVAVVVMAGNPAQLKLVSGPQQPLQVINGHGIPTPFLVQLYDEWGNHTSDQSVTVEVQPSPPALKVTTADTPQPVDTEGKSSFTVTSISGPKGYYQLEFKGSFNSKPIPGPTVNLTVLPDPNKPVSLKVEYNTAAVFHAGGSFPVFLVTVVSDEGIPMTNFNPAAASMWLWEGVPLGNTPPPPTPELKCSKPMENERQDCFHFRDKEIPERVGRYTVQFSLRVSETDVLYSNQIALNVVASQPVKLAPDSQPAAPVVSCCTDIASRTLVENMMLRIMDSHGNPAGQDLSGKVVISITSSGNKSFPLFEGTRSRSCHVMLADGKAHITRLAIMANSPGEDGCMYTLFFKPEVSGAHLSLTPFELTFHFYNDAVSQLKMTEMVKKKSELTVYVARQKEFFSDSNQLLNLLTDQFLTAKRKEAEFRDVLIKNNVTVAQPISIQEIDTLLNERNTEADMILQKPRRVCSIPDNFRGQQDVLGKVGHLAYVQDDAAAKVSSWFIRGDMDCVITRTSEAAQRIYRNTQGKQQVMPLDTVFVGENRPLPHIRQGDRMLFDPPGNPVYVRDLLIYPHDQESCKKAFKNILGDTILIDDLESANNYRRLVVQNNRPCPTILTREGDCVSSKGKFGGKQNKAPPNITPVFGAPLPQAYHTIREQIGLLNQYRAVVEKREKTEKDREEHLKKMKSPQMEQKQKDLKEKVMQLEELERRLGSKPVKRGPEDAGEPSGIITKRAK